MIKLRGGLPGYKDIASLLILSVLTAISPASAGDAPLPESVWNGTQLVPDDGLPDGGFAIIRNGGGRKLAAWYGSATTRYRHGILGDAIEAGSLHVEIQNGHRYSFQLPHDQVFEDRTPRLVDLNGDGQVEVITIRSFQSAGASVALFGIRNDQLVELASTEAIGRANRWLNIAGVHDYAGRGKPQIAYVETPHIGGTLFFVEWQGNNLVPIASMSGFSNHQIGSRNQDLSGDLRFNDDTLMDIAVPSDNRRSLRIIGFQNGQVREMDRVELPVEIRTIITPAASSDSNCLYANLENHGTIQVCPSDRR